MGRRSTIWISAAMVVAAALAGPRPVAAAPVTVTTAAELEAAWEDPAVTQIVLGSDVELGCELVFRSTAPALVFDGAGHQVTTTCDGGESALGSNSPLTVVDARLVGRAGNPTVSYVLRVGAALRLESSTVVARAPGGIAVEAGPGSVLAGSVLEGQTDDSDALWSHGDVLVDRSSLSGGRLGILGFDEGGTLVVRDSSVTAGDMGIDVSSGLTVERSAIRGGGQGVHTFRASTISDSTIVAEPEPGQSPAAALVVGRSRVQVSLSTLVAVDGDATSSALLAATNAVVEVVGTVLTAGGGSACAGEGQVVSEGANVAVDDSCGFAGPGDLVADPGLPSVEPSVGYAVPALTSPVVDHVPADLCASTTDQRGVTRPQGAACDAGAVEVEQADPPGPSDSTTSSVPAGPPPAAPPATPATPIRGTARFAG